MGTITDVFIYCNDIMIYMPLLLLREEILLPPTQLVISILSQCLGKIIGVDVCNLWNGFKMESCCKSKMIEDIFSIGTMDEWVSA